MEGMPSFRKKEQGPDPARVESFRIPIEKFVKGDPEAIEILRTAVKRDSTGKMREEEIATLKRAYGLVQEDLKRSYEKRLAQPKVNSVSVEKELTKESERLAQLREQLAFAA